MKYLLLLLLILWATPVSAATTWESYSNVERTVVCDDFASGIVYMKGEVAKNKNYRAIFYDADNDVVLVHDGTSDATGLFKPLMKPSDYPASSPGTWKAELYRMQPYTLECTDTFVVRASAIPEIPDVLAGIAVAGLCLLIYRKMRRRSK